MKNLAKGMGLLFLLYLAGCNKNDPTCLPYEGIILNEKNSCLGNRTVLQVVNKKIKSEYFDGKDTVQNVVIAVFPDTASLQAGQKVYFDYEIFEEPYLACFSLITIPKVQVKITRLSYRSCSTN